MWRKSLVPLLLLVMTVSSPVQARPRGGVYHAGSRVYRKSIERAGLSMKHAKANARFGKGAYFSLSRKGSGREKPGASAIYRGKLSRSALAKRLDTRRMSGRQLKAYSGLKDMRGTHRNGVIGPKLGRAISKRAGSEGRVVYYRGRGTKRAWSNVYVPADLYKKGKVVPRLKRDR